MGRWDNSTRSSRLPSNWRVIRQRIFRRDGGRCTWAYWVEGGRRVRCERAATEVDHIVPGDDHSDANLRSLCDEHHEEKTRAEGTAARMKKRREIHGRYRRPKEEHPAYAYMRAQEK